MATRGIRQPSPRVLAARKNGSKGGKRCLEIHGADFAVERGIKAGNATRERYGKEFYSYISKLKKNSKGWPKGKPRKLPMVSTGAIHGIASTTVSTSTAS